MKKMIGTIVLMSVSLSTFAHDFKELLSLMDYDHNGKISYEEFSYINDKAFVIMDSNRNDIVERSEATHPRFAKIISRADSNHNGKVGIKEFTRFNKRWFKSNDLNGNNSIVAKEFYRRSHINNFFKMDKDNNKVISKEEYMKFRPRNKSFLPENHWHSHKRIVHKKRLRHNHKF